jgi:flagellar hook-basal body complex protein FliE
MKISGLSVPVLGDNAVYEPIDQTAGEVEIPSFADMLGAAVRQVNGLQKAAEAKNIEMITGQIEDLSEVTIAAEKAMLALQLTLQVRNRAVEAYQEIMRMQM